MSTPKKNEAFREEFHDWLQQHFTAFQKRHQNQSDTDLDYRRSWEDYLCSHGWAGLSWPSQYGGKALTITQQAIVHEELARVGAPLGINLIGHGILAPTLIHYGTEAQKERFLPKILDNTEVWCQGYSEPGAGSDLASIRTSARKVADGYVLNGHKIWTSFANLSDWCFVLARTDPDSQRHKGLSFLLVNMRQPGVRVEAIKQLTGNAEFCEVFFEDVFVENEMLVSNEGDGWRIAMAAASFERGTYFIPRLVKFNQELQQTKKLVDQAIQSNTLSAIEIHSYQQQWSRFALDSYLLQLKSMRALHDIEQGKTPGPEGSSTKVHWSEAHQKLLQFAIDLIGLPALLANTEKNTLYSNLQHAFLNSKAETILAGTSEVQRTIIAEKILGLPK